MTRGFLSKRTVIKTLVLIVLAWTPLQLVLIHYGEEPWPALALPNFSNASRVPNHFALQEIYLHTEDGERVLVEWPELFPELDGIERSFLNLNFSPRRKPPSVESTRGQIADTLGAYYPISNYWAFRSGLPHGNDPDVRDWLNQRILEEFEGQTFVSMEFVWYGYEGFIRSSEIPNGAVRETYVVDLR